MPTPTRWSRWSNPLTAATSASKAGPPKPTCSTARRTGADDIEACLSRADSRILLAERPLQDGGRELLACAHVAIEDGAGYFGMFSVRPNLQGGGIGKALLAEAERVAREEWQLPTMRMTVIDIRDELIAFYERRGYRRTGIKKAFPVRRRALRQAQARRPALRSARKDALRSGSAASAMNTRKE